MGLTDGFFRGAYEGAKTGNSYMFYLTTPVIGVGTLASLVTFNPAPMLPVGIFVSTLHAGAAVAGGVVGGVVGALKGAVLDK